MASTNKQIAQRPKASLPKTLSASAPIKTPLSDLFHLSGSLQSIDDACLLEDEGGDVDAQLLCGSLGGKLSFQSLEASGPLPTGEPLEPTDGIHIPKRPSSVETTNNLETQSSTTDSTPLQKPPHDRDRPLVLPSWVAPPLTFDLVDARIFREGAAHRRFVLYTITICPMAGVATKASIEKRFSDFDRLHRTLKRSVPAAVRDVVLPGKRVFNNFDVKIIAERSRAFEQYLGHICGIDSVRATSAFAAFFYGEDVESGLDLLLRRRFLESLPLFHRALDLAVMVVGGGHRHSFLVLCCLATAYDALNEEVEAQVHARAGVEWLRTFMSRNKTRASPREARAETIVECKKKKSKEDVNHSSYDEGPGVKAGNSIFHSGFSYNILTVPLIELAIRLSWKLGIEKKDLEESLDMIKKEQWYLDDRRTMIEALQNLRREF